MVVFMQLVLLPYARVVGTNLLWNHMTLGGTQFRSTQRVRESSRNSTDQHETGLSAGARRASPVRRLKQA